MIAIYPRVLPTVEWYELKPHAIWNDLVFSDWGQDSRIICNLQFKFFLENKEGKFVENNGCYDRK